LIADHIIELLTKEGFLVKIKPIYKNVTEQENCYEVLVTQSEAQEVRDILMDNGY
jgi:hypothetical protein